MQTASLSSTSRATARVSRAGPLPAATERSHPLDCLLEVLKALYSTAQGNPGQTTRTAPARPSPAPGQPVSQHGSPGGDERGSTSRRRLNHMRRRMFPLLRVSIADIEEEHEAHEASLDSVVSFFKIGKQAALVDCPKAPWLVRSSSGVHPALIPPFGLRLRALSSHPSILFISGLCVSQALIASILFNSGPLLVLNSSSICPPHRIIDR